MKMGTSDAGHEYLFGMWPPNMRNYYDTHTYAVKAADDFSEHGA